MRLKRKKYLIASIVILSLISILFIITKLIIFSRAGSRSASLEQLRSLPYINYSKQKTSNLNSGVIHYDPEKTDDGYNLYCSRSAPEAYLMDMAGNIVHSWKYRQTDKDLWDHVILLENGDIVVVNKNQSLIRLSWNSNLIWKKTLLAHHDVIQTSDKSFYVIEDVIRKYRGLIVRFPLVVHISPEGQVLDEWSALEHFDDIKQIFNQKSFFDTVFDKRRWTIPFIQFGNFLVKILPIGSPKIYDYFHLNTITVLPETKLGKIDERFKAGNLLICFRNVNQIGVLERETKKPVWAWGENILEWPHHPTMLRNGNILVFDNGVKRKFSEIIELDPTTNKIVWEYSSDPPKSFYSKEKGSAQRLQNENTLICEGDGGRVFEVTKDGEIVWEWINPSMKKRHRETVYRMTRIPFDKVVKI